MTCLPSDFLHGLLSNKFINGFLHMEDLVNTNMGHLSRKQCHFYRLAGLSNVAIDCVDESEPGPRLRSSEIWAMNDQMNIQV